jgi:hypothetical protein
MKHPLQINSIAEQRNLHREVPFNILSFFLIVLCDIGVTNSSFTFISTIF